MAVKKNIEDVQGKDNYPWGQQLLIHNGKVLKDESTLEENKVSEDGFLVVMLSKSKASASSGASSGQASTTPAPKPPAPQEVAPPQAPAATDPPPQIERAATVRDASDAYGQAASNVVAGSELDPMVNHLMEMGGGSWDRDTVQRALRAAYNNPERAVEYLYSGIPVTAEIPVPAGQGTHNTDSTASALSGLPNTAPLNMFPQGGSLASGGGDAGTLDFLRSNQQFQALRDMVQANPQILQPMLQELSKQNPQLLRLIQENHAEFLQLLNEPAEGGDGEQFELGEEEMPHSINVTPEEQEAIARLEAMGFDRARVLEAFIACDRNEQLAANYLLEHAADED